MRLKYRRHVRLVVVLVLLSAVLVVGMGDQRIVAYAFENDAQVVALELSYQAGLARLDAALFSTVEKLIPETGYQ